MRRWTDEVDAKADALFRTLSEAELRGRQDICAVQIRVAYKAGYTDSLADLQAMEDALARELLRRTDSD